jgi:antitoxin component of MazEF toxin-antitoxin module
MSSVPFTALPRQKDLAISRVCIYDGYTCNIGGTFVSAQAILKWGNSLAFRIPSAIAKQMNIFEGAEVEFRIDGQRLIIEKADEVPRFTHHDLVKALKKAKQDLVDLGSPRGKEIL